MTIYVNGQHINETYSEVQAGLSGHGVFTTFYLQKNPYGVKGLNLHLERLQKDTKALFGTQISASQIMANLHDFLKFQPNESVVRITILKNQNSGLDVLITTRALSIPPSPFSLQTITSARFLPNHKTISGLGASLHWKAQAQHQGFDDVLFCSLNVHENSNKFLDRAVGQSARYKQKNQQLITEGSTWAIGFIKNDQIIVPKQTPDFLPSITRQLLTQKIDVIEKVITDENLENFEAAFACASTYGIHPILQINATIFDKNHPLLKKLKQAYKEIPATLI